ncbi:hypothetical protein B0H19DRAFT_1055772 [Mycena capillaripes]|nr:hypothetical protein B0H19DRAFT_1055772 [Mycena capillaripes]
MSCPYPISPSPSAVEASLSSVVSIVVDGSELGVLLVVVGSIGGNCVDVVLVFEGHTVLALSRWLGGPCEPGRWGLLAGHRSLYGPAGSGGASMQGRQWGRDIIRDGGRDIAAGGWPIDGGGIHASGTRGRGMLCSWFRGEAVEGQGWPMTHHKEAGASADSIRRENGNGLFDEIPEVLRDGGTET